MLTVIYIIHLILHFFSISTLLGTLFSPWKRLKEDYKKGLDIAEFFTSLAVNILMRILGAIMRSVVILVGLFALVVVFALGLLVFVEITLTRTSSDTFEAFSQAVIDLPQVLECHLVSGNFDYLIKARVADMTAYRKLLGETLLTLPGVSDSRTYVVMEEVKEHTALSF